MRVLKKTQPCAHELGMAMHFSRLDIQDINTRYQVDLETSNLTISGESWPLQINAGTVKDFWQGDFSPF